MNTALKSILMMSGGVMSKTPSQVANLAAWFDASDATTLYKDAGVTLVSADGDAIAQINDKSGNSRVLSGGGGAAKPLYKINIQNGLSIVRFDGADDILSSVWTNANVGCNDGDWCIIGGFTPVALNTNSATIYQNDCLWSWIGGYGGVFMKFAPNIQLYHYDGSIDITTGEGIALGVPIVSVSYQTGGVASHALGKNTPQSIASGNSGGGARTFRIATETPIFTQLDLHELFIYSTKPSDADIVLLLNYLIGKWNYPT
jgi:hypothetical protein